MKILFQLFILTLLISFISCSKSEFEDVDNFSDGKEYIALETGKYRVFQYDTIAYSGVQRDTLRGFLKYEIGDSFMNNSGDTTFKLNVYYKKEVNNPYTLKRVETIRLQENKLIESQNGLNFIKLVFPALKNNRWSGNSLFDTTNDVTEKTAGDNVVTIKGGTDWKYKISDIGIGITSGDFNFENGLVVNLISDTTFLSVRNVNEYYAEGVGIVKKEATILTRSANTSIPLIDDAENGYIMKLTLIDFN